MEHTPSILSGVTEFESELQQAVAITATVAEVGFDWPNADGIIGKIQEELAEVYHEIVTHGPAERMQDEIGDLLFAVCNLARHLNIDPQLALQGTNQKFTRRFNYIEQQVSVKNKSLTECSLSELDELWNDAKQLEKKD
jgi:uncharacterized protein YabN with tetrapyrrole methylase and pyrophosphatase domain